MLTHWVKFKDKTIPALRVDLDTAMNLVKMKRGDLKDGYPLKGAEGRMGKVIFKSEIESIDEIDQKKETKVQGMRWICDCGRKNFMHVWPPEKCECRGDRTQWLKRMVSEMQSSNSSKGNITIKI